MLPGCNMEVLLILDSWKKPEVCQGSHHHQNPKYKDYHHQHKGDDTNSHEEYMKNKGILKCALAIGMTILCIPTTYLNVLFHVAVIFLPS